MTTYIMYEKQPVSKKQIPVVMSYKKMVHSWLYQYAKNYPTKNKFKFWKSKNMEQNTNTIVLHYVSVMKNSHANPIDYGYATV